MVLIAMHALHCPVRFIRTNQCCLSGAPVLFGVRIGDFPERSTGAKLSDCLILPVLISSESCKIGLYPLRKSFAIAVILVRNYYLPRRRWLADRRFNSATFGAAINPLTNLEKGNNMRELGNVEVSAVAGATGSASDVINGAASGASTGSAIGGALGGPVGSTAGAFVGAIYGGLSAYFG